MTVHSHLGSVSNLGVHMTWVRFLLSPLHTHKCSRVHRWQPLLGVVFQQSIPHGRVGPSCCCPCGQAVHIYLECNKHLSLIGLAGLLWSQEASKLKQILGLPRGQWQWLPASYVKMVRGTSLFLSVWQTSVPIQGRQLFISPPICQAKAPTPSSLCGFMSTVLFIPLEESQNLFTYPSPRYRVLLFLQPKSK